MTDGNNDGDEALSQRHLRFGWWALLVFLTGGIALEGLHAFKSGLYMDVDNETRRLMWTLAHAHGTLLALVHVAYAVTLPRLKGGSARSRGVASRSLVGAAVLMPTGFALGGLFTHSGDPGLGILLVPIGAVLLFVAVLITARAA